MAEADELEAVIARTIAAQPIPDPGVAGGGIKDTKCFFMKGFGLADRNARTPVSPDTLFAIGSATKAFTSMAVGMLVDQQLVKFDTPIVQYMHDFALQDTAAQAAMTLEDILGHRTGLPRHDPLWYLTTLSSSQLFHRLRYLDPDTAPGKGFRKSFEYNNMTYLAANYVLERFTNGTWADFIKARLLEPFSMANTNLSIGGFQAKGGHPNSYLGLTELPLKDFESIGPSARINSNITDMVNWVLLHLNRGVAGDGSRLVQSSTLDKIYEKHSDVGGGVAYALGWFVTQVDGNKLIYHQGNADGYSCYVSFLPDKGTGVIVLSNQHYSKLPDTIAAAIYQHLAAVKTEALHSAHATARAAMESSTLPSSIPDAETMRDLALPAAAAPAVPQAFTGTITDYTGVVLQPALRRNL